jgi:uncharacterized phage protein (TIGR02220 family)
MNEGGIFLTNYEANVLKGSDVPVGASKVLLELKERGGICKGEKTLADDENGITYWEVRAGVKYLVKYNILEKVTGELGKVSIIRVVSLAGTSREPRGNLAVYSEVCPKCANELKEKVIQKENTADSDSTIVNSSFVFSTNQKKSQNIPSVDPNLSKNDKLGYDISHLGKVHFIDDENSCQAENAKKCNYTLIAKDIIKYLNEKAGKNFSLQGETFESNRDKIKARIKGGSTIEQLKAVVDMLVEKWGMSIKMAQYLRPSTIFGKEKFANYVGELGAFKPPELTASERVVKELAEEGFEPAIEEWKEICRKKREGRSND